jgi:hypothetical protein
MEIEKKVGTCTEKRNNNSKRIIIITNAFLQIALLKIIKYS